MPMFQKVISKSRLITGSKYVVSFLSFLEFMTNVGLFANPDLWPASLQFTNGIAKPDTSRKLSGRRHINKHKETDKNHSRRNTNMLLVISALMIAKVVDKCIVIYGKIVLFDRLYRIIERFWGKDVDIFTGTITAGP